MLLRTRTLVFSVLVSVGLLSTALSGPVASQPGLGSSITRQAQDTPPPLDPTAVPPTCPVARSTVSPLSVIPGGQLTLRATGFAPFSIAAVSIEGPDLSVSIPAVVDALCQVGGILEVPPTILPGTYSLRTTGTEYAGGPLEFRATVTVVGSRTVVSPTPSASMALTPVRRAPPTVTPGPCVPGALPGGALSLICVPSEGWNGGLLVWAHGYVASDGPLDFYHLGFSEGEDLSQNVQGLGLAFATTSYRRNGLVVLDALDDVRELVAAFQPAHGKPRVAYLVGVSEGGLITTLLLERYPGLFDGGLAACGPIGDFQGQIRYLGDFRVLFDYFFPGLMPGSAVSVPPEAMDRWESEYVPGVARALAADPLATGELLAVSGLRPPTASPAEVRSAVLTLLWYSVFATNDAVRILGGNPYDNTSRWYSGSARDEALNGGVQRFSADAAEVARYETSGLPPVPLVTIHTEGDELVPYWHMARYRDKGDALQRGMLRQVTVHRFGHCNFTSTEILIAVGLMMQRVDGAGWIGGP